MINLHHITISNAHIGMCFSVKILSGSLANMKNDNTKIFTTYSNHVLFIRHMTHNEVHVYSYIALIFVIG